LRPENLSKDLFYEAKGASEIKKALKSELRIVPAEAKTAEVLQPTDGAFDGSAQFVAILRAVALEAALVGSVRSCYFHALHDI